MTSAKIVVWEWLNKFGKWCPYTRNACQHLEQAYSKNLNSVWLGDCDILLKNFTVNLKDMLQVSERSGTTAAVRRQFCDEGISAVVWQWRGDHHVWHCYNADIADIMENAFQSGKRELDLSSHFSNYPYKISFLNMVQKNKRTKHHRPIQRITSSPYPVSNLENGFQEQANGATQFPSSDVCDSDAVGACAAKPTEKTFIMKQVSAFWNKFKKSVDSDSNVSSDEVEELSVKKKQCTAKNTSKAAKRNRSQVGREVISPNDVCLNDSRNRNSRFSDADMQFATVNGKVWKYPSPPSTHQSLLKPVPGIDPLPCDDRRSKKKTRKKSVDTISMEIEIDVIDQFTKECSITPSESEEEQVCIICYESLLNGSSYDDSKTLVELQLCSHIFHKSCVKAMYDSGSKDNHLQCPTCKTIHGVKCGSQPQGTMVYHVLPYSLPGYPECDTIRIIYDIPAGFQGPEHPHPGHHYTARGFPRHCYLPDNEMGRKVIRLLIKAWERKLIFTIGMSSTTGEENTVTWNEIHHKTEFGFNRRGHGFPDPNYFENIIAELAAHGVTESTYAWTPA